MSYEGFSQFLCKNGHLWEEDCWSNAVYGWDMHQILCPICNESAVFENLVSQTNCCIVDEDGSCDCGFENAAQQECFQQGQGYIDMEKLKKEDGTYDIQIARKKQSEFWKEIKERN